MQLLELQALRNHHHSGTLNSLLHCVLGNTVPQLIYHAPVFASAHCVPDAHKLEPRLHASLFFWGSSFSGIGL